MNPFTGLKPEEGDNIEINNPKECKRAEKRLRQKRGRFEKCNCEKTKGKLFHEIQILEIEIREYNNRDKGVPVKKNKPKSKTKTKEFKFDEDEIRKYNEKRKRENEEKAKKEREERRKRKEKYSENWKKWDQKSKSMGKDEDDNVKKFIKGYDMKMKDVPKEIKNLIYKFSLEDYKKLSRKYHPDKLSGKQEFMYILNGIRDHYIKREVNHDETWTK